MQQASAPRATTGQEQIKVEKTFKIYGGLLHHGLCSEEFEPRHVGTDYFAFFHRPCRDREWHGLCNITAVLIDNRGRIIFNLKCKDCGFKDALKTSPNLFRIQEERLTESEILRVFHLSPKLKARCRQHWWDDE